MASCDPGYRSPRLSSFSWRLECAFFYCALAVLLVSHTDNNEGMRYFFCRHRLAVSSRESTSSRNLRREVASVPTPCGEDFTGKFTEEGLNTSPPMGQSLVPVSLRLTHRLDDVFTHLLCVQDELGAAKSLSLGRCRGELSTKMCHLVTKHTHTDTHNLSPPHTHDVGMLSFGWVGCCNVSALASFVSGWRLSEQEPLLA